MNFSEKLFNHSVKTADGAREMADLSRIMLRNDKLIMGHYYDQVAVLEYATAIIAEKSAKKNDRH